jgi:hypothetical protein
MMRSLTKDDAIMQERFTVPRSALEFSNNDLKKKELSDRTSESLRNNRTASSARS